MKSELHDVRVFLHHETDKAWLVSDTARKADAVWVPKSQAEMEKDRDGMHILTAPDWLLTDKKLV